MKTPAGAVRCCGLHGNIGNLHGTAVDASGYLHGRLYGDDRDRFVWHSQQLGGGGARVPTSAGAVGVCTVSGFTRCRFYTVSGFPRSRLWGFHGGYHHGRCLPASLSPQPRPEKRDAEVRLARPISRGVGETPILEQPWRLGGTRLRPPRTRRHRVSPSLSELRLGDSESVSPREAPPLGPRHSEPGRRAAGPSHHAESDVLASSRRTLKRTGPVQIS